MKREKPKRTIDDTKFGPGAVVNSGTPIAGHERLHQEIPVDSASSSAGQWTDTDIRFMEVAISHAELAQSRGEVPVGAVLAKEGRIVAAAGNQVQARNSPLAHAEMIVLAESAESLGRRGFAGTTLYVTLEPCVMCAGALVAARVESLVFGARDERFGGCRSVYRIADDFRLNHRLRIREGLMGKHCVLMLNEFFRHLRLQNRHGSV